MNNTGFFSIRVSNGDLVEQFYQKGDEYRKRIIEIFQAQAEKKYIAALSIFA